MTKITAVEYDFVIGWDGTPNRDIDIIVNNALLSFNTKAVKYGLFYRRTVSFFVGEVAVLESTTIPDQIDDDIIDILEKSTMVERIAEMVGVPSVMKLPEYSRQVGVLIDAMESMLPKHDILIDNRDSEIKMVEIQFANETTKYVHSGAMVGSESGKTKAMIVALMNAHTNNTKYGGE